MRIELDNIVKHYGSVCANDGVSLTVESGSIHGLLGENGAGKTTLMKILSGYQSYDAGEILLDRRPARFSSPAQALRQGIGMLHQDPLDVPALTVLDNFLLGRDRRLLARYRTARRELAGLSQRFGFHFAPDALVSSLTIGERQQLEIVRLLSLGVRAIILDEPTTGISAPQKALLFATLHRLAGEGLSVIFVSHKLDEVAELCSRATVLRQGKVAGVATAPFSSDRLLELMFSKLLCPSPRPHVPLGDIALELEDVAVRTYRLSVEHATLTARRGEVIGFAGLEGSGQDLLMRACAGLERIASGRLAIAGQDMSGKPYRRFLEAGVAFVPAARLEEGMVRGLTILDHSALVGDTCGLFIRWQEAEARAGTMIQAFNIIGRPETEVQDLSGGNQQRALLALVSEQLSVLMLEHPTRGLDVESSHWVWQKLLQRRESGAAILFTSTDLDELVENSDRIVVFSSGVMSAPVPAASTTCEELGMLIVGGRR